MRRFILLVLLTLPVINVAQEARNPKLEIYELWNKNRASLLVEGDFETGKWPQLYESLSADPPEMVRSLNREQLLQDLIKLHTERIEYLKRMLELEKR